MSRSDPFLFFSVDFTNQPNKPNKPFSPSLQPSPARGEGEEKRGILFFP